MEYSQHTKRQPTTTTLHSIRKPPAKPWRKQVTAPQPQPQPPKVYRVVPSDFRSIVQKLTGAPEFQPGRLQNAAPPPLNTVMPQPLQLFGYQERASVGVQDELPVDPQATTPFEMFSPSWWCSLPLMSPGTRAL